MKRIFALILALSLLLAAVPAMAETQLVTVDYATITVPADAVVEVRAHSAHIVCKDYTILVAVMDWSIFGNFNIDQLTDRNVHFDNIFGMLCLQDEGTAEMLAECAVETDIGMLNGDPVMQSVLTSVGFGAYYYQNTGIFVWVSTETGLPSSELKEVLFDVLRSYRPFGLTDDEMRRNVAK